MKRFGGVISAILLLGCAHPNNAPPRITEFQADYRFLSNSYHSVTEFEGIEYPTVEHAYQSAKTLDTNERRRIAALPTPAEAKRAGRQLALRPDWEQVKFEFMEQCVRYKFTHHPDLRRKLLATGAAYLEEGNTWGDTVWGVYNGQGENRLGKLLMKVRTELWANKNPPIQAPAGRFLHLRLDGSTSAKQTQQSNCGQSDHSRLRSDDEGQVQRLLGNRIAQLMPVDRRREIAPDRVVIEMLQ